jgi:N12 class adenine-specific DNA methylase
MGKTSTKGSRDESTVWLPGFSPEDFLVPSVKTPIAEIAAIVAESAIPMASPEQELAAGVENPSGDDFSDVYAQVLQSWGEVEDTGDDLADRKAAWPTFKPSAFAPAASAEQRIEDNIAAIKLLKELQATPRPLTDADRNTLLRYCGWGGLARVFSPDGSNAHQWAKYRDELASITTEAEFNQMRSSITSAFFTDAKLIESIWTMIEHLGFKGGRILEPSSGNGLFLAGMPKSIYQKSEITAVELDPVTAGLTQAVFAPLGVQVHQSAIEKARIPAGFFDLVVGNIPFGNYRSLDTSSAPYADWLIHNYFIGKAVDVVRPGGLIVLITSTGTMDSKTQAHREWLAAHAELLGAFRLPTMAFKQHAGTEVATDVLILRRREVADYRASGWIAAKQAAPQMVKGGYLQQSSSYKRVDSSINEYYVANKECVLGQLEYQSGQYETSLQPVFDGTSEDLSLMLDLKIATLPAGCYEEAKQAMGEAPLSAMTRYEQANYVTPGTFKLHEGRITVSEGEELLDVDDLYTGMARERVLGMLQIRDALKDVIAFQAKSDDDVELQNLQVTLNQVYDAFVSKCGFVSQSANARLLKSDPDWGMLLACEVWDDEEQLAVKADIFSKRTVGHRKPPARVESVKDAMLVSLGLYGRLVLKDMALRSGRSTAEVVQAMTEEALAYRDPAKGEWVPADEYLSGHIRNKIALAQASGATYERNVQALQTVLPKDLGPAEVEVRLGAPWVPTEVLAQFACELVQAKSDQVEVKYNSESASWSVTGQNGYSRLDYIGDYALRSVKWGTNDRSALVLLEAALNQTPPTITKEIDGKRVPDKVRTMAAREKYQAIRDRFRDWVYEDHDRSEKLLRIYNDAFNQIVERKFDGSHLILEGMSSVVTPYPAQKDAIWRGVTNGNMLLAHSVGAGKTLVLSAVSMELRRLRKAAKPLHVVQNSTLEQYTAEFIRLYPQAKVLMATKDDLHGVKRRAFTNRIATSDVDAVIMTQATFERLALSPETQRMHLEKVMSEVRLSLSASKDSGANRSLKELERKMKDAEARLERLAAAAKKDEDQVWFEELGVDAILYDEAHALKNLPRISKMPRVSGLSTATSQRAFDAHMKCSWIMEQRGDVEEGVILSTATPITNSIAETWVFQRFLQPQTLKRFGVLEFDAWSASFGEIVTGIELSPDGGGYRVHSRYARFVNVPELMSIFRMVADIKTAKMLNLPTPKVKGGKAQAIVVKPSEKLLDITASLVERADRIRGRGVQPGEDNMLKVTGDGRKAALDVRMVDQTLPFDPEGKLAAAAREVHRIWSETAEQRGTQLVFSDIGTPGGASFNLYGEFKRLLVLKGIPAEQIEFAQDHGTDAQRSKLHKRVREGSVRVLMGSTQLMGIGTNVQRRLKAVHQLDAPWTPADVIQRDGRGERQGNMWDEIELLRYITEKSFDAYSWNLLTVKANFIEQVMTAGKGLRSVEDVTTTAMTYAEIKAIASGNPLVLEKAQLDSDLQRLSMMKSQFEDSRYRLKYRAREVQERLKWIDQKMTLVEADATEARAVKDLVFKPSGADARASVDEHGEGAAGLGHAFKKVVAQLKDGAEALLGSVGGFNLFAVRKYWGTAIEIEGPASRLRYHFDRSAMTEYAVVGQEAFDRIKAIANDPADLRAEYGRKSEEMVGIEAGLNAPFDQAERLAKVTLRLREIEAELDLDKDEAGTEAAAPETA